MLLPSTRLVSVSSILSERSRVGRKIAYCIAPAELFRGAWPKLQEYFLSSRSAAPSKFIISAVLALDVVNRTKQVNGCRQRFLTKFLQVRLEEIKRTVEDRLEKLDAESIEVEVREGFLGNFLLPKAIGVSYGRKKE